VYLVFRCSCGRHLYAPEGAKARTCPCGKRIQVSKAKILAKVADASSAGDVVRELQIKGRRMTGFTSAVR
jgi:hypothetical protein